MRYWDRAADVYSASRTDGPLSVSAIYEPVVDELVGDVGNKHVLNRHDGTSLKRALGSRGYAVCPSALSLSQIRKQRAWN